MKKVLILVVLMILFPLAAIADGVCHIPKNCEFISSEFSTGGGDKSFYIMEVDCKINGNVVKYIDVEGSAAGFLGLGRVGMPRKVVFKKTTNDEIECDY